MPGAVLLGGLYEPLDLSLVRYSRLRLPTVAFSVPDERGGACYAGGLAGFHL